MSGIMYSSKSLRINFIHELTNGLTRQLLEEAHHVVWRGESEENGNFFNWELREDEILFYFL